MFVRGLRALSSAMSMGSMRDCLARSMAFSAVPPIPMPSMPGGHQPAPRVSTVPTTQSATESLGLRAANLALFSEPPPLAATWTSTLSPATMSTWRLAGVLSPVLRRSNSGSTTMDARSGLSVLSHARRTPSSTSAWSGRAVAKRAPTPTRMNTLATPVSWQIGRRPKAAMRELARICAIALRAAGLSSRAWAAERFRTKSAGW